MRNIFSPKLVVNLQCMRLPSEFCTPISYFSVQIVHSKYMYIYHQFEDIFTKDRHSNVKLSIRKTWQISKPVANN